MTLFIACGQVPIGGQVVMQPYANWTSMDFEIDNTSQGTVGLQACIRSLTQLKV